MIQTHTETGLNDQLFAATYLFEIYSKHFSRKIFGLKIFGLK